MNKKSIQNIINRLTNAQKDLETMIREHPLVDDLDGCLQDSNIKLIESLESLDLAKRCL